MKPSFENSVDVLVKAYLNDELEHGKCSACAVGNLVCAAKSIKPMLLDPTAPGHKFECNRFSDGSMVRWDNVFMTAHGRQVILPDFYTGEAQKQIDSTGYTWQKLARIEYAFETADCGNSDDEWMFNGLMAVVDVLADIHGISLEQKQEAKSLFVKAPLSIQ